MATLQIENFNWILAASANSHEGLEDLKIKEEKKFQLYPEWSLDKVEAFEENPWRKRWPHPSQSGHHGGEHWAV